MNYIEKLICAFEYFSAFLFGAVIYFFAEIVYRGHSHITMFFAGGICFFLIYTCEKYISEKNLIGRCILYAFIITAVEFVFGAVFNIWLGLNVWDYSDEPFNFLGQICPAFTVLWIPVSLMALGLHMLLSRRMDRISVTRCAYL